MEWQGTIVIAVHDMPAICASGNGDDGPRSLEFH